MVLSAILVALLATLGQWWFFGPVTKCLVYPLTTGTLVGLFMGDPMTGMLAGAKHSVDLSGMDFRRWNHAE